jgi:hypothetical protein
MSTALRETWSAVVSGEHLDANAYRQTADALSLGDQATLASMIKEYVI